MLQINAGGGAEGGYISCLVNQSSNSMPMDLKSKENLFLQGEGGVFAGGIQWWLKIIFAQIILN